MTEQTTKNSLLKGGIWLPELHQALSKLIAEHGIDAEHYDPERPPLAVIDSQALVRNNLGEAMMRFLIIRRRLKTDRGFWNILPERLGRDALNAAHKAIAGRSDTDISETAAFRRYQAGMLGAYESIQNSQEPSEAALFAAQVLRGLHERSVAELAEMVLDQELQRPLGHEEIPAGPPFSGLIIPTGIRVYEEMLNLIQVLSDQGFSIWLIGSANLYILKALARRIAFPEEHVLGLELQTQGGNVTDRLKELVPVGEDKLDLFLDTLGRSPTLMIGSSMEDCELLKNCEGLSVVIGKDDEKLQKRVEEFSWMVQPGLSV